MSEDFLEVLNVRDWASKQIPFFMHVAILPLPILMPFLNTMHTLIPFCRSPEKREKEPGKETPLAQ